jgi:sulfonate transport system substrate-binding protein
MTARRTLLASLALAPLAVRARAAPVLRMGDQRGNVQAMMQAAGVLESLPYRLDWSEFAAAAPLAEAMKAGAVDGGVIGDAPFIFAVASGAPIRAVAARRSSQEGLAVLVRAASPAQHFPDLRGKRVATGRGSIGHYLVLAALRANAMTADDVQLAFLQPADAKAALAGGSVDAWSTWEPYTSQAEVLDGARRVVTGEGLTPGLGFQAATVAAIEGKTDELADFVRRMAAARAWANANLDRYAAVWAKLMGFPESVPQHWFHRTRERIVPPDAQVAADLQPVADTYAGAGLLRTGFDARAAMEPRFADAIRAGSGV